MKKIIIILFTLLYVEHSRSVQLSKGDTGEVLIFPYYTVNGGFNTLVSLTNSKNKSKALRVRFREAANSKEVFAFNLYLGPYDVWTGALVKSEIDGIENTLLLTSDASCTIPANLSGQKFNKLQFTGDNIDAYGQSDSRLHEGFLEVIEMGVLEGDSGQSIVINPDTNQIDCSYINNAWNQESDNPFWFNDSSIDISLATGGLSGSVALIDVLGGLSISEPVTALVDFSSEILHTAIENETPTLADADAHSTLLNHSTTAIELNWPTGYEAVSSVLSSQYIQNEYILEPVIGAKTDWITTLPTKQFHTSPLATDYTPPFENQNYGGAYSSCEPFNVTGLYDREENEPFDPPNDVIPGILPPRPRTLIPHLCYASNVIPFSLEEEETNPIFPTSHPLIAIEEGGGDRFQSKIQSPFRAGWISLHYSQFSNNAVDNEGETTDVYGLPMIGFSVQTYSNLNAQPGLLANYAGSFEHQFKSRFYSQNPSVLSSGMGINHTGKGQVLLYPYYSVRNDLNTLISVVNTSNEVKALKVRFREAKNNRVVKSFNLYLSAYDVWVAALVNSDSNQTGHEGQDSVKILTADTSCTVPSIHGEEFTGAYFDGQLLAEDGYGTDLTRLQEGSIEIIEMTTVTGQHADAATHYDGVPGACEMLSESWQESGVWTIDASENTLPPDGLGEIYGSVSLINVYTGFDLTYNATAIVGYSNESRHTPPDDIFPSLAEAHLTTLIQTDEGYLSTTWDNGVDAISALFMSETVNNDYVISSGINAVTEWVEFFPTKQYYTDSLFSNSENPLPPFSASFTSDLCVPYAFSAYNRDQAYNYSTVLDPIPPVVIPPPNDDQRLCSSTNVISIESLDLSSESLFDSQNITNFSTGYNSSSNPQEMEYQSGWMNINFNSYYHFENTQHLIGKLTGEGSNGESHTFYGLPVLGFVAQKYINGTLNESSTLANYGVIHPNRVTKKVIVE